MREGVKQFLAKAGWAEAQVSPIAGDLSARSYIRLTKGADTAVLMDDAGGVEDSLPRFLAMTRWLHDVGLSAPRVLDRDPNGGLLLLEDLGQTPVSAMLSDPTARDLALDACLELLLALRQAKPPALPCPTASKLCEWTRLVDDYYPGADPGVLDQFRAVLEPVLQKYCQTKATVALRDFHADNLMWLPDRAGVNRLGLLDYQDAILTHPVYDLVSLLTDARSEIAPETRQRYISTYAEKAGDDLATLSEAFAAFSLQRNLRILGIFHRAARVDGKAHHLPKVPRVYRYLTEALEHPAFSSLRPMLAKALPAPEANP